MRAQSCRTLRDPMDCSPPGSPVNGVLQAGILEWVATAFLMGHYKSIGPSQVVLVVENPSASAGNIKKQRFHP